jgi:hypothetical protein
MATNFAAQIAERFSKAVGLAKRIQEIHFFAQERRGAGRILTFRQACAAFARSANDPDERNLNNGPEVIYEELGINPNITTIRDLMTTPDIKPFSYLVPEVLLDGIMQGFAADNWGDIFIKGPVREAPSGVATVPIFPRNTLEKVRKTAEAADPFLTTISFAEKQIRTRAFKHGFDITYDSMALMPLDAAAEHMRLATINLQYIHKDYVVEVLKNGEKPTDKAGNAIDESVAVIGVDNTTNGWTYKDLRRAWIRMGEVGGMPSEIITCEENVEKILDFDEFKKREAGTTEKTLRLRQPLPSAQNLYSYPLDGKYYLLVNPAAVVGKVVEKAPMVESEKLIRQQKFFIVYSEAYGLYTKVPTTRVMFDATKAFSSNKWPAWFAPMEFKKRAA